MRRAIVLGLVACSAAPHAAPPPPRTTPSDAALADGAAEAECECDRPTTSSPLVVSVDHGACDGHCRMYSVSMYRDGTIDYFGFDNVAVAGRRTAHVDMATVDELGRELAAIDFSKLPRSPSSAGFPAGAWVGTVTLGTGRPADTVYVDFSDPRTQPLTTLVDKLDALAGVAPGHQRVRNPCPPSSIETRILSASVDGGVVRMIVAIGAKRRVTPAWKAQLVDPSTDELLPGGELAIADVRERETIVTMAGTAAPATSLVRLWLPDAAQPCSAGAR